MRISDWSSDVCSSDLPFRRPSFVSCWIAGHISAAKRADQGDVERELPRLEFGDRAVERDHAILGGELDDLIREAGAIAKPGEFRQIGRASCRERVCQ